MRRALLPLAALMLVGWPIWAAAQTVAPAPYPYGSPYGATTWANSPNAFPTNTIQGTVWEVDPFGRSLTLTNGTVLTIPYGVGIASDLKPGAVVTATYQAQGSQNLVTMLNIDQPPSADHG